MSYPNNNIFFLIIKLLLISIFLTLIYTEPRVFNPKWDLPTDKDLNKYLRAVERVVDHSARIIRKDHQVYVGLAFALFLVNGTCFV